MARVPKCRRVCMEPVCRCFLPAAARIAQPEARGEALNRGVLMEQERSRCHPAVASPARGERDSHREPSGELPEFYAAQGPLSQADVPMQVAAPSQAGAPPHAGAPSQMAPVQMAPAQPVVMSVEELESLRLCDLEGFGQDEAARRMEVSRQTLQRMLYSARAKTAQALTQGLALVIGGGNYSVSTGGCGEKRPCSGCMKWKSEESES